ncbi:MAG: hypothetical protein JW909_13590 [Planctomycetes bacterium]|nr:hypothetical protein [Planctomycetota bacterium]
MKRGWLAAAAVVMAAEMAYGAVPQEINFQGRLSDTGGTPYSGAIDMEFRLYDSESGIVPIWTETHSGVAVDEGLFSVQLGSTSALTPGLIAGAAELWLGVEVDGDGEMAPRYRVVSAAMAILSLEAENADTLDGQDSTDFAAAGHDHDATYVNEGQAGSITSAMIVDSTITGTDIAADTITAIDIAASAVGSSEIANGSIAVVDLQDGTSLAEILDDDGSGSGLDADYLDGLEAAHFSLSTHDHDAVYVNEGQADSITSAMIVNGVVGATDMADGAALAEILDDDGSGSGLDADYLDGLEAGHFSLSTHSHSSLDASDGAPANALAMDADGNATVTGTVKTPGLLTGSSTSHPIVIRRLFSSSVAIDTLVARSEHLRLTRAGNNDDFRIYNDHATMNFPSYVARKYSATGVVVQAGAVPAGGDVLIDLNSNDEGVDIILGNPYFGEHYTEVHLFRYGSDYFWLGTLITTWNQ